MNMKYLKYVFCGCLAFVLSACAPPPGLNMIQELPIRPAKELSVYRIAPGDTLDVKFFYMPDLNENVTVRPDGKVSLRLVDDVALSGLSVQEADDLLTRLYKEKLSPPVDISVLVRQFESRRVYVSGEVESPGELALRHEMTVLQAITAAGGLRNTALNKTIVLIRKGETGHPELFRVNLSDAVMHDEEKNGLHAFLEPQDIVYVPKSGVARANLFVDQHIRQMLMLNGFSFGATGVFELNDADN